MTTTSTRFFRAVLALGAFFAVSALSALAQAPVTEQTVDASSSGYYSTATSGFFALNNYIVGYRRDVGHFYRDFASFRIPTLTGPLLSATLRYYNPSLADHTVNGTDINFNGFVGSGSPSFQVYGLTGTTSTALSGGTAGFYSLATGTFAGSTTVNSTVNGTWVTVTLNADALALILSSAGSDLSFGGSLATESDFLFGTTNTYGLYTYRAPQLVLTQGGTQPIPSPVPEPSTYGLMGAAGLLGIAALRRRLSRKAA